jgi:hypothetical protein
VPPPALPALLPGDAISTGAGEDDGMDHDKN